MALAFENFHLCKELLLSKNIQDFSPEWEGGRGLAWRSVAAHLAQHFEILGISSACDVHRMHPGMQGGRQATESL